MGTTGLKQQEKMDFGIVSMMISHSDLYGKSTKKGDANSQFDHGPDKTFVLSSLSRSSIHTLSP
jgi:hypothetical protein